MIADIETPGETPFDPLQAALMRLAICCGDSDTVRRCLDEGADPNACDAAGNSPLKLAASLGQTRTCDVLLQYGADPTVENPDVQTTPDVAPRGVEPTPAQTSAPESAPVAAAAPLADATLFEGSEDAAAEAAPFERRDDTWPAEPQPIMAAPAMPDPAEPEPSEPALVVELAGAQPALTEPVVVDESFSDRAYRVAKALLAAHPGPRMARAAAA